MFLCCFTVLMLFQATFDFNIIWIYLLGADLSNDLYCFNSLLFFYILLVLK